MRFLSFGIRICGFAGLCHAILALAAFLVLLTGCDREKSPPAKPQPPLEVKTTRPSRGPITRSITLPGEVKAYQEATLYAKVPGYLKSIAVDKGDPVKEGSILAEIEVPELLAERSRDKAEVEVAEIDFRRLSESQMWVATY